MPKKKPEIVFVRFSDWEGIYIDGELKREDHSLASDDVLSVLGIEYEARWIDMEDGSRLPRKLSEIKDNA